MLYINPDYYLTLAKFPSWRLTVHRCGDFLKPLSQARGPGRVSFLRNRAFSQGGLVQGLLGQREGAKGA